MSNVDPDLLARFLPMAATCYALQARKTANLLARSYNQALAGLGLEVTQFSTLCVIAAARAKSVSEMAEQLGVDRSTLVRNLKVLQQQGLITTQGREGRRLVYGLTREGAAVLVQALPRWEAMQEAIAGALHGDGSDDPRKALGSLRRAVRVHSPNQPG